MVLRGGPDRERPVSLLSGDQVAQALLAAGHEVLERDISPDDLSALLHWERWGGDVVFPTLHGPWGEGGPLQRVLEERGMRYVGCGSDAADLCMDKHRTKLVLASYGLPTPDFELIKPGDNLEIRPPVVLKAPREGSSIDLAVCHTEDQVHRAFDGLAHHPQLLVEQYIAGDEFTVGVIGPQGHEQVLPPVCIVPAQGLYDFQAKYERDDTRYLFDHTEIGLPTAVLDELARVSLAAHRALGCRHMSRVDLIVDRQHRPWILEVNTIPGFTSHSLLPKAAAQAGLDMPALVDHLVRLAVDSAG